MNKPSAQSGFSLIELVISLVVIMVMLSVAIINLTSPRRYSADDQARKLSDFLDEARQMALNQKSTFRVEIDKTKNQLTLIDEGDDKTTASDDAIVKTQPISGQVVIGVQPASVAAGPVLTSPVPAPSYASSTYPLSSGDQKITMRFRLNGEVLDAGTDNVGTGSIPTGATLYVTTAPSSGVPDVIRAVTVLGTSGDTSIYKCSFASGVCGGWYR